MNEGMTTSTSTPTMTTPRRGSSSHTTTTNNNNNNDERGEQSYLAPLVPTTTPPPPTTSNGGEKEFDISVNLFCWVLSCPCSFGAIPYRETLYLGRDEVTITETSLCGETQTNTPYGELGSIDRSSCLCWRSVRSGIGSFSPGCGCNGESVDELARELRTRIRERGETAQMIRAEQALQKLDGIEGKLDTIMESLSLVDDSKPSPLLTSATATTSDTFYHNNVPPGGTTATNSGGGGSAGGTVIMMAPMAPPEHNKMKDRSI